MNDIIIRQSIIVLLVLVSWALALIALSLTVGIFRFIKERTWSMVVGCMLASCLMWWSVWEIALFIERCISTLNDVRV